jgi:regulator of replication initiation timing
MNESTAFKQLLEQNTQLRLENGLLKAKLSDYELLKAKISELEARLAQYENAHTPPSLRRGRNRKKDPDKNNKGNVHARLGTHEHENLSISSKYLFGIDISS